MKIKLHLLLILTIIPFLSIAQTLDQNHTGTETVAEPLNNHSQSLTCGLAGTLTQINIDVEVIACIETTETSTTISINVYDGNGTSGTLLTSDSIDISVPYSRNLLEINLSNPISVSNGQIITIDFSTSFPQTMCNDFFTFQTISWFQTSSGNTYSGGNQFSNGSPINPNNRDFYFQTYVNTALGLIENDFETALKIYPNPSNEYINISGLTKNENYIIYNAIGTILVSGEISNNEKIDTQKLNSGLYFLKFNNGNAQKFIKK